VSSAAGSSAAPAAPHFTLTDWPLACGWTLPSATLVYQTYGTLNAERSNAILYPTSYAAHHTDIDWLVGPDKILDTNQYFVIIPNMFGNGLSTSPSNLAEPFGGPRMPIFEHVDNVTAQRNLLQDVFQIEQLALIYGWSMGAQQALLWGCLYPDGVQRIAAVCGTARTSPHNRVFLEGLKSTLLADPAWNGERFTGRPERGLRAFARVYAGWALSQTFYRQELFRTIGFSSLEDFLIRDWEASFLRRDAANLVSMIETWLRADISRNDTYHGDLHRALQSIQAVTWMIPSETDLYFTVDDCRAEASEIRRAELRVIPSVWGHRAGNPLRHPPDQAFLKQAVRELLSVPSR
jgi:homoserine O-acetyltransferase/O-succinyltransferase